MQAADIYILCFAYHDQHSPQGTSNLPVAGTHHIQKAEEDLYTDHEYLLQHQKFNIRNKASKLVSYVSLKKQATKTEYEFVSGCY